VRYSRATRWFHTAVYVPTIALLGTGWWLLLGREGEPSLLAKFLNAPDVDIHKYAGWALAAIGMVGIVVGKRAARTFIVESLSYRRSDARWVKAWPRAILSGRFAEHAGHFDPGQRAANILMGGGLLLVVASGIGLVVVHGGPAFVWMLKIHRWSTFLLTPILVGHVIVASGVLPGYKGAWRAMHWRGDVTYDTARRLWPVWAERATSASTELPKGRAAD
jgi:cytochrome b subunit of formate dehydrogenase